MQHESHASATSSPRIHNDDSMKISKDELAASADRSLRDSNYFQSLEPARQVLILDVIVNHDNLSKEQRQAWLACSVHFLNSANEKILNSAHTKVMPIVRRFVHSDFLSLPEIRSVVLPLGQFIERLLAHRHAITALHAVFLQLCVTLDIFDIPVRLISSPMYDIDSILLPTSLEYLTFHYFSGLVFAAFKRFDKALASFDLAIGAVATQISSIQIAAYKKRVLIDIILNGSDATPLPKLISPVVLKNIEALSAPYNQFDIGSGLGPQTLEAAFREHQSQLQQDGNVGLAKQALSSLQRMQIAKLAGSYMTISLFDIVKMVGIENLGSVEDIVLNMIEEGAINATIDQSRQMLTFCDDPDTFTNQESLARLFEQLQDISAAHNRIINQNIALATDTRFLTKSVEGNARAEAGLLSASEMHFSEMQQLFG